MPYIKPGVEIKQVQQSFSPVLPTPSLELCVIGDGYWVQDISWEDPKNNLRNSVASEYLEGSTSKTIALSGINPVYYDVTGNESLVHIDLLGVSGPDTGKVKRLIYGKHFSVSNNVITISGIPGNSSKYQIKVGYRAKRTDKGLKVIESISDIKNTIGEPVSYNPLAFGLYLAILNSSSKVNALQLAPSSNPVSEFMETVNEYLNNFEVYVLAPVTHNIDVQGLSTHCNVNSLPENKQERIAIINKIINYPSNYKNLTSTQKQQISSSIRDSNSAIQNRRIVSTHPDAAYVLETRHVSTVKPSWIQASFSYMTNKNFSLYGPYAKLVSDVVVGNFVYKAGTEITEEVWETLYNNDWGGTSGLVTVLAPVPGFYFNAAIAGQVISYSPEQPLTNLPVAGFVGTVGSKDIFTESNLNVMAEGGTYILVQNDFNGPIYCRHQLTTDITSIAKRELSITKSLDYISKMLRNVLFPYIGRNTINENFLKLLRSIVFATGNYYIREGIINDFKLVKLQQDTTNPDTILIEVEILVKYPVNYIKITLIF